MRKLKLLFAALALTVGGASSVWAQTDVTNYIKDADFSEITNWTKVNTGGFFDLGNGLIGTYTVRASGDGRDVDPATVDATHLDTEYCLGMECRWSSNYAAFNQTTEELPAGVYTLTYDVENVNSYTSKQTYENRFYVKVGETQHTDTKTEWMGGKSDWTTHSISFTLEDAATITISLGYGMGENNIRWQDAPFIYVSHLKLEKVLANKSALETAITNATKVNAVLTDEGLAAAITTAQGVFSDVAATQSAVDAQVVALNSAISTAYTNIPNGKDLTAIINNAAVTSTTGWTNGRTNSGQQYTDAPDNTYMDTWNATLNQKQVVQLPAGFYMLKAATRADASLTAAGNIYALVGEDNNSTDIEKEGGSGNLLGNGWAWTRVPFQVAAPSDVTIGFYSECGGSKWAGADDFKLKYYKTQDALDAAMLEETKGDWIPVLTGNVPTAAITAINNATSVSDAKTAIASARGLTTAYAAYLSAKAGMDAVALVPTTDNEKAASRKAEYLDAVSAEAEAATTAEAINTAIGKIKAAVVNYVKKLTPADAVNAPFDLTFMITNPSFANNNADGWTANPAPGFQTFGNAEYYMKNFDISQTLTDMATGSYRLKVKAYQRTGPGWTTDVIKDYLAQNPEDQYFAVTAEIYVNGGNEGSQKIKNAVSVKQTSSLGGSETSETVNETTYYIPNNMEAAGKYFAAGLYDNETEITATTNTVKFGFRCSAGTGNGFWTIFDNFRLYYTGQLDLSVFQASLDTKVTEAGKVKAELTGKVPTSVLTALQNVVDANDNDDSAFDDEEQFTTAIANINAAITAAQGAEVPYTAWKDMKAKADVLAAVDNDNDEALGTFNTAINTQNGIVEAATEGATIESATSALKTAMVTYCGAANPVGDGAKFDMTFMLTNPDVTDFPSWAPCAGWYTEQEGGNFQVMNNNDATSEDGTKTKFYEYYSNEPKSNNKFNLYQAVTLGEGTYTIKCYAFAAQPTGGDVKGVYFYANETPGSLVENAKLTEQSISFVNDKEKEVKIGLKSVTGNTYRWMGIGYMELYKVPAVKVTIAEDVDYTPEGVAGQVTLKRTLSTTKWNTFVVPFQITNEELTTAFGAEVAVAEYSEASVDANDATVTFTPMATPAIVPNKPVLLKPSEVNDENTYVFANRTIATGDAKVTGTNFDFVGSYAASTTIAAGDYFFNSNKLYKSTGKGSTIKGTRAYIKAKSEGARITNFVIDGEETTGIMNVEQGTVSLGKVYNMQGQQVKNAQKGIFIQNGKKVVIK